jgi:hypothetical protein
MKKVLLSLLLAVFLGSVANAQAPVYGNEWINYNQRYFYFKVVKDDIYRINAAALAGVEGFPVSTLDHRRIQVFGRAEGGNKIEEVAIFVQDNNSNNILDGEDFIEFYAKKNDGIFDRNLYSDFLDQPNPYYSLFNDTAIYYITWNSSTNNKRMVLEDDNDFSSYTPSPYFFKKVIENYTARYNRGGFIAHFETDPDFTKNQGWFDQLHGQGAVIKNLNTPGVFASGPNALLETVVIGYSQGTHGVDIDYSNNSGGFTPFTQYQFESFDKIVSTKSIASSTLGNSVNVRFNFTGGNKTMAYIYLEYPHIPNLNNANSLKFTPPERSGQLKIYYQFTNLNASGDVWVYDLNNNLKIKTYNQSGQLRVLIPTHATSGFENYITSEGFIGFINNIQPVGTNAQFINYTNSNADYIIVTHKSLLSGSQAYSEYRKTKGFQTVVVDIDQLYHQFGYGIEKHPLSIKNFSKFALDKWTRKPEHLFLIGKSIASELSRGNNIANFHGNLVPSYGSPASDNLLTAGINGTKWEPAIATGRLAARTNQQVLEYLNKMKDFESYVLPEEWMKTVLHFGGGTDYYEQITIRRQLEAYQRIIEAPFFGGTVKEFYKTTSSVIDMTLSDSIRKLVNQGTSIMTFFGHASGSGFDINIDKPESYQNYKKYPLLIANSCYVGDIHGSQSSTTSEEFVLIPDKGVIGFIAHVNFGFIGPLSEYTQNLYRSISLHTYGESIGNGIINAVKNYQVVEQPIVKAQALYMTFHGDPAIVLNSFPKPDISVAQPDIYFSPSYVTTDLDSFKVNVILTNLAKAFDEDFNVELTRRFSDGTIEKIYQDVRGLVFKDTLVFTLPVNTLKGPGENAFEVFADSQNQIDEMTKMNNKTSSSLKIFSSDIVPVYPYPFSVVPDQGITLKAVTSDPLAQSKKYIIEIDTTDIFNSPLKQRHEVVSSGGVVRWKPSLLENIKDSTVFFWRTSPDSSYAANYVWRESSFQFIKDNSGWGQAHFFQHKSNDFNFIDFNRSQRRFNYLVQQKQLFCYNLGNPANHPEAWPIHYKIDLTEEAYGACGGAALAMAVIDGATLEPWKMEDHSLGQDDACAIRTKLFFYPINSTGLKNLENALSNQIPDGHYILIYSLFRPYTQQWSSSFNSNLHDSLQKLGASPDLLNSGDSIPFIFFVKKGDASSAQTIIGTHSFDEISLTTNISRNIPDGNINSVLIGPAEQWHYFKWQTASLETPDTDDASVDLFAIDRFGNEILWKTISKDEAEAAIDLDAELYRYIRLKANLKDTVNKTPAQIKRWHVLFDEAPEATLNASKYFSFKRDTVEEGDHIKMRVAIENISRKDMDSLTVFYSVEDASRVRRQILYGKLQPLKADSIIYTEIDFSTIDFIGRNTLRLEINPRDANWQREQHHFNNILQKNFFVGGDKVNPLLDVTFDGIHLLDGDIVSPKPMVLIQLKDENKYRALNDTSNFAMFLIDPDGNLSRLYFNEATEEKMRFHPAVLPKNSCRIEWTPAFTKDGEYELRVQAKDASGNLSGRSEYTIGFNVISNSSITEVLNYPNPFSTSTRFVFTLTGTEIPSHFKIQIMTVTGKVVKEIHKEELGPIRIGRNISEYAWDGRDEFGDQLANGVYLYRVITRINGSEIERRASEADTFFHKGFGKMYLLR